MRICGISLIFEIVFWFIFRNSFFVYDFIPYAAIMLFLETYINTITNNRENFQCFSLYSVGFAGFDFSCLCLLEF